MLEILRNVDYNPHFFHIHTFNSEEEKWSEGQIISTQNRGKRTFINYPKKFREEEFEKIRQRSFENFPSRYTCLFLSEDMDTAKFWLDKLFNRCNFIQFVEVELYLLCSGNDLKKFLSLFYGNDVSWDRIEIRLF